MTTTLNSAQLDELLASGKPVIVDFFATWCQPCKAMAPHVDALSEALAGTAEVVKVDIEVGHEAAAKYKVRGVPTFMAFKNGAPVASKTGAMPKQAFTDWATAQVGLTVFGCMTAEAGKARGASPSPIPRTQATLQALPRECVANLYRHYISTPRNEGKGDMLIRLWAYAWGKPDSAFWTAVERELDFVARCKSAKASGLPKPKI